MNRAQYWMLNGASLAVALLIGCEISSVHQLDRVTTLVQQAQTPLVRAQQEAPQVQALVRRTAIGATRDPALKELLFKYGIALTIKPSPDATPASPNTSATMGAQVSSAAPNEPSSVAP